MTPSRPVAGSWLLVAGMQQRPADGIVTSVTEAIVQHRPPAPR